jgi:ZIP family zinc transporter
MAAVLQVLAATLPAVVIAAAGGLLASARPLSPRVTAAIQHLAAGIVFAATTLELLPQERTHTAPPVILGFALGLAVMLGVSRVSDWMEARQGSRLPVGLLAVIALDLVIDGLVLGMAFATGEKTGLLLSAALSLEVLFLALSSSAALAAAGAGRLATAGVPAGLAALLAASAVVGRLVLAGLSPFQFAVGLGIGIVALLYLVTEELLIEAHAVPETAWATAAFFVGFLVFLVLEMTIERGG